MASALATAARPGRPGCAPRGGVERRRAAACAAVGSPCRPILGQLLAQHPVSRLSTRQQGQQQQEQQQPDAEPQLGAARQQAQRQLQDGQPQRPDWQLRRVDTLPALLQLAMPQPKRGEAPATLPQEGGPQQQQAAAAGGEQPADEYRGPKLRYGRQVSSLAELEAAVLDHWSTTAGDRIPGTDKHESLALPGLADIAVVSRAGREYDDWKLSNQDCHLLLPLPSTCTLATAASSDEEDPVAAEQQPHAVVLGVFDGHGLMGTAASRYTRQFIATGLLRSQWRHVEGPCEGFGSSGSQDGDMGSLDRSLGAPAEGSAEAAQQLLEAAFECAGAGILNSGLELRESGSTAVVCHVEPGRITTAWCGDSRAVLGLHVDRQEAGPALLVHPLTEDHRPDRPLERARIEAAGGQVVQLAHDAAGNPVGPFRLCGSNLYMAPRPMVSRAFGDTNAVEWGLTHTPDLLSVEFPGAAGAASSTSTSSGMSGSMVASQSATDSSSVPGEAGPRHVLILGSDGFFDTTSMIDACVAALDHSTALEAAQTLADSALRRWAVETQGVRCDDITVVVAFLPA